LTITSIVVVRYSVYNSQARRKILSLTLAWDLLCTGCRLVEDSTYTAFF